MEAVLSKLEYFEWTLNEVSDSYFGSTAGRRFAIEDKTKISNLVAHTKSQW